MKELTSDGTPQKRLVTTFAFSIVLGVMSGAVSAFIAITFASGGHGIYSPAAVLFPYTMLSTRFHAEITGPFIWLALAQYPLYGVLVGWAARRSNHWYALGAIFALHTMFAIAALFGRGTGFYP